MKGHWTIPAIFVAVVLLTGFAGLAMDIPDAFAGGQESGNDGGKGKADHGQKGCDTAKNASDGKTKNPHCIDLPPTTCEGTILGGTFGNVEVPAGATCEIRNVIITGSLTSDGAESIFILNSEIAGDVNIQNPTELALLSGTNVGGDVTFTGATGVTATVGISVGTISGDTIYTDNDLLSLLLEGVNILGNVVITGNLVIDEVITGGTTVDGDVLCDGNSGTMVWDSSNIVGGTFSGDCPLI